LIRRKIGREFYKIREFKKKQCQKEFMIESNSMRLTIYMFIQSTQPFFEWINATKKSINSIKKNGKRYLEEGEGENK
jgi:hypothetical protein